MKMLAFHNCTSLTALILLLALYVFVINVDGVPEKLTDIDGKYSFNHTSTITAGEIILYTYPPLINDSTVTVYVTSHRARKANPLQITFRSSTDVFIADLPWIVYELENDTLSTVTQTLCLSAGQHLQVQLLSFDSKKVDYRLEAVILATRMFNIDADKPKSTFLLTAEPKFFTFCYEAETANVLRIKITSKDQQCALVGFHGGEYCETKDHLKVDSSTLENGFVQSMMTVGGTVLAREQILYASQECFHVEFVLLPTNLRCMSDDVRKDEYGNDTVKFQTSKQLTVLIEEIPKMSYFALLWFTLLIVLTGVAILFCCALTPLVKLLQKSKSARAIELESNFHVRPGPKGTYICTLAAIAIFYLIPALQLIYQYLYTVDVTGNQDLCYYNFLCAKPLGPFFAFNNVFSNIGYIWYGIMFILVVKRRRVWWKFAEILYAMGLSLILEGILSAAYHICPKVSNFQFDTTFMYITAGLCIYYLHYVRNPGKPLHSHFFFAFIAIICALAVLSIVLQTIQWRVFLIVVYVITVITFGVVIFGFLYMDNAWIQDHARAHKIICITHSLINVLLLGYSMYTLYMDSSSFPSVLLNIFIGNLFLFVLFYVVLKCLKKEVIVAGPVLCLIIACASWTASLYLFNMQVTDWRESAAESREKNQECMFMGFFDQHDVWHWLSALSMLFTFLLFLTIDDGQMIIVRRNGQTVATCENAACDPMQNNAVSRRPDYGSNERINP